MYNESQACYRTILYWMISIGRLSTVLILMFCNKKGNVETNLTDNTAYTDKILELKKLLFLTDTWYTAGEWESFSSLLFLVQLRILNTFNQ